METIIVEKASTEMTSLFDNANLYWALAIYIVNALLMTVLPSKVSGSKWYHVVINYVLKVLNVVACNFYKARNIDDVNKKKK